MAIHKRTGHVIDSYSIAQNSIVCVCGWKGEADKEWEHHKAQMRHENNFFVRAKKETPFQEVVRGKKKNGNRR